MRLEETQPGDNVAGALHQHLAGITWIAPRDCWWHPGCIDLLHLHLHNRGCRPAKHIVATGCINSLHSSAVDWLCRRATRGWQLGAHA